MGILVFLLYVMTLEGFDLGSIAMTIASQILNIADMLAVTMLLSLFSK
jgi:hypothetical protein